MPEPLTIRLTISTTKLAIILDALQEYQGNIESAIHFTDITGSPAKDNDLLTAFFAAGETEELITAIKNQL